MAVKAKFTDAAKELETTAQELFERIKQAQTDMSASLQNIRRAEGRLSEKEEEERKARVEREKAERLREILAQGGDLAFHVGAHDEPEDEPEAQEEPQQEPQPEAQHTAPVAAAQAPAPVTAPEAPETQAPAAAQRIEPPVQPEAPARAEAPVRAESPTRPAAAQPARPQQTQQTQARPQQTQQSQARPQQTQARPQQTQQARPQQPQQQRPQQGPFRPQSAQGYDPRPQRPQQPRQDRPYLPRPAQPGTGPRPQQGTAPRTAAGPRPATPGTDGYKASPQARTVGGVKDKRREENPRIKNKKTLMKEKAPTVTEFDDETTRRRSRRKGQMPIMHRLEPIVIEKAVITTETITVKALSEKIGKPAAEIIKKLFMLGIMATINQEVDFDTCALIASDYNITLTQELTKTAEDVLAEKSDETDAAENLETRPPVVTIMGHVDHGKTSLLDAIRKSSITEGEAGGITQHIGAYTVSCNGRTITFIDTPGHEAFTAMRARGAQVTDIVILVVAADDGIMPQTVEAINHSKAAGVPIIVAINKIDKPTANPERVLQQLTEQGLVCEDWGGDTICVPVSAKTQEGLDNLLEMVLLQADVLELKANPNRMAKGTIVEAELDKGRGPIATVLVQNGTLHVGDPIVAGMTYGRVRAMMDDKGRRVDTAGPSMPVSVLGFSEVPSAGDVMNVAEIDKLSRQVAEERRDKQKAEQLKNLSKVSLDDLFSQIAEGEIKTLNIIIKADVQGSVEAVRQALEKLSNEEVHVKCIHGGVGAITGSDVMFASASNAIIIGFNVRPDSTARETAARENVDMRMYRIIYDAIEEVQKAMKGMFAPVYKENLLGHVEVRNTFKVSGVGTIAGCYVKEGKIQRNAQVRVVRDGVVIHEGKIGSLKRFKDDAREVAEGYECGVGIDGFNDIHEGDIIENFVMEEVER